MIYLDTSVVLAQLLAEDRRPEPGLWSETLVSSRLLEYEAWTRLHARGLGPSHGPLLEELLARVAFIELRAPVLARAREPWDLPVRTLDALHLASLSFLLSRGERPRFACYDRRLAQAAESLGIEVSLA
jgi:hypothetical protein